MNKLVKAIPDMEAELKTIESNLKRQQLTKSEKEASLQKANDVKPYIVQMETCLQELEELKTKLDEQPVQISHSEKGNLKQLY